MKSKEDKIEDALLKVALGCRLEETTEEYGEVDGELKLLKRKLTKKDVPPDLKAVQLLLAESGGGDFSAISDEELEAEKTRLLEALKSEKDGGRVAVKKKSVRKNAKKTASKLGGKKK